MRNASPWIGTTLCPKKRATLLWRLLHQILIGVQNPSTAKKSVKFPAKQLYHYLPHLNMLPHYLEKVKCSNLMHFCILHCVPLKKGSYQTHGGNFITSQLTIIFYGLFCESAEYLLDSEPGCFYVLPGTWLKIIIN